MTEELENLVESEVEELESREDVRAVAVVGSYARQPDQEHNDIDLYIIVDGDWRKRKGELVEGVVFEKFFNSMELAKSYLEEKAGNDIDWYLPYSWFTNADVRYDPENLFQKLADQAEDTREKKMSQEVDREELLYNIWDLKQDIETDDVGQKRYMMYQLFDYLLEKHYSLKDELPVKENYRVKKLQDFDGYMYKLAQDFLNSSSTHEKEQKLEKMIDHVTRSIGEPGPEWETEKEFR